MFIDDKYDTDKEVTSVKLDHVELNQIEYMARALTIEQCFARLKIDPRKVSEKDMNDAKVYHEAGVMSGIVDATDALFKRMSERGGAKPSVEYLRQRGIFKADPRDADGNAHKHNAYTFDLDLDKNGKNAKKG